MQTTTAAQARLPQFRLEHAPYTATNAELIAAEFKNNRSLYEYKLRRAGIAPCEVQDALCELFTLAIQWSGSYDANKSGISSWLGNQVVRTVTSSMYGTRRPSWRHQQARECSTQALMSDGEQTDADADNAHQVGTPTDELAVMAFLHLVANELTPTEAAIVDICGTDLLHERQALPQLIAIRDLLGVRSLTTVRTFTLKLGRKVRALALEHFDAEDLTGRPGFDRLAA